MNRIKTAIASVTLLAGAVTRAGGHVALSTNCRPRRPLSPTRARAPASGAPPVEVIGYELLSAALNSR